MRILVTGAFGFVGKYLCRHLAGLGYSTIGMVRESACSVATCPFPVVRGSLHTLDNARRLVSEIEPDAIVHLASSSSVAYSWKFPTIAFLNNAEIFANLIEAIRLEAPLSRLLSVGSSEQYGAISKEDIPVSEAAKQNPISPYAAARVAQEHISLVYNKGYKTDVVCTRSFNHIGAGQSDSFVVSSLARQAVEVKYKIRDAVECGDLSIIRDFIDVRDVVDAYTLLLANGISGEVYNICSGIGYSLDDIFCIIQSFFAEKLKIKVNSSLLRPIENPIVIGSPCKLLNLGFVQKYKIHESIASVIEFWDSQLRP